MAKSLPRHLAVLLGFCALAVLYSWPLVLHTRTHFGGIRSGDTGIGSLWNLWYFRHALTVLHCNPFWTDLMYWPYGSNLFLTNYTLFNDVVAFFLMPRVGLSVTHAILYLGSLTLAAYGVYLLLRDWDVGEGAAFVSGAAFAFSPAVTLQPHGARDLYATCVNAIPFFVWLTCRAVRGGRGIDAALAALALTWAWSYNYYYFTACVLFVPLCFILWNKPVRWRILPRQPGPALSAARCVAGLGVAAAFLCAAYGARRGQVEFHGRGSAREVLLYVAPYLAFWGLLGLRVALQWSVEWSLDATAFAGRALKPYAAVLGFWFLINLPVILCTVYFMASGDYGSPPGSWRGGGDAFDLVWLLMPQQFHPLWGEAVRRLLHIPREGAGVPVSSIGIIALAAAAWLWRRRPKDPWFSVWYGGLAFYFLTALGPWLRVLGVHTYLPLPFFLLHLLPIYNNITNGWSFYVVAAMFMAVLFGFSLQELMKRLPSRRARWAPAVALALLAFEFAPGPALMYELDFPPLIHRLGARPDGAMLTVPVSAHFPHLIYDIKGVDWLETSSQIVHHKPIVGGFLPRVSRRVLVNMTADPFFTDLLAAQDGAKPSARLTDPAQMSRYFQDNKLRYVLVETALAAPKLMAAVKKWPMNLVDQAGAVKLYEVRSRP